VRSINRPPNTDRQEGRQKFAGETPAQRWDHREIAWRYGQDKRRDAKFLNFRKCELERLFSMRYGMWQLPDDDAGRGDLCLMADHLAQLGEDHVRRWACIWAPWAGDSELDDLIEQVGPGRRWKAQALANELGLDNATRTRLRIRTIGAVDRTKAQRGEDYKIRKAAAEATRRAKAGAAPHALSAARLKPWLPLGISESTYYRRKRQNDSGDSNSCRIFLESQCSTNCCQGAPPPPGGSWARAEADAERVFPVPREAVTVTVPSSM